MNQLPKSWSWVSIVELLDKNSNGKPFQQGWSPQCHNHPASENCWGVLKTTAIQDGEFWGHENKELPESIEPRPHLEVVKGDILMTCAGPRNRCGVVCFVKKTRSKLLMSGKMYRFRPNSTLLDSKYLEGFIRSHQAQRAIDSMKTGISDSGLNLTHGRFSELMVPLAPLSEQKRIVAKIEELFSELDSGIASLKTAREQLKIYRQALLKHAFEGKLTEQWRKDNADKLETPEQLLARIQTERETRYQQQLEEWKQAVKDWEAKGKEGKKPSKPREFKEIELSDHVFNEGWLAVNLGGISNVTGGLTKNQKRNSYGIQIPYLRVANVYANELRLDEVKTIGVTVQERETIFLEKNDLLVVEGNGSIEQIGRVALWNGAIQECGHQNHLIRARLHNASYAKLILYFLLSPVGRDFIVNEASSTSGLHTLSLTKVSNILEPVYDLLSNSAKKAK
ncbi:hypothetical protein Nstercoris_00773 [Nitrosomonas stercoris]|uniref:Type I restriction modification DNA specificity domain-containing protein n=1 Tax=Nitrosomonas stercoris TaxID=1444684 RepID=A0A4Y1YR74_9PROT|nr:hypothetical protein Nstercoris_00773 [Nitrosomonas stercoris]